MRIRRVVPGIAVVSLVALAWHRALVYLVRERLFNIPVNPLAYNFTVLTLLVVAFPVAITRWVRSGSRRDLAGCLIVVFLVVAMLFMTVVLLDLYCVVGPVHIDCVPDYME